MIINGISRPNSHNIFGFKGGDIHDLHTYLKIRRKKVVSITSITTTTFIIKRDLITSEHIEIYWFIVDDPIRMFNFI